MPTSTIGELYVYGQRDGSLRRIDRFGPATPENRVASLTELTTLLLANLENLSHFMHSEEDLLFFAVPEELNGISAEKLERLALIRAVRLMEKVRDQLVNRQRQRMR